MAQPSKPAVEVIPDEVYLRKDYGKFITIGNVVYIYQMYATTTFGTKIYKYTKYAF